MKYTLFLKFVVFAFLINEINAQSNISEDLKKAQDFYEKACYDSASYYFNNIADLVNSELNPELFCRARNKLALCYLWMDFPERCGALCYQNIKDSEEKLGSTHHETAMAYLNYGVCKFVFGPSQVSPKYFHYALSLLTESGGDYSPAVAKCYEWLGTYYESEAKMTTAWYYLNESLKLWVLLRGENHPDLAELYRYFGLYYKRNGQHDSAIFYFTKAKTLFDEKYSKNNFQSVKCLNNLADVYAVVDSLENKVMFTYDQCDKIIANLTSSNRMVNAMTLYNRAEYVIKKGNYEQAIKHANKILSLYFTDFKHENIFNNPDDPSRQPYYIPEITMLFKAGIFLEWMTDDPDNELKYLIAANDCYTKADQLLDALKKRINNLDDQFYFTARATHHYDNMALTAINTYNKTGKEFYLDQALRYLEKKSFASESFKTSSISIIPKNSNQSLWEQKIVLQRKLTELTSMRSKPGSSDTIIKALIKKSIELDLTNEKILHSNFVQFDNFQNIGLSIDHIRKRLSSDETLIVQSESKLHDQEIPELFITIAINTDSVMAFYQKGNQVFKIAGIYHDLLSGQNHEDTLFKLGIDLYDRLFGRIENVLKKKLIIIPSAHLSLIPFDALPLNFTPGQNNCRLMIEDYLIWKSFSISSFLNGNEIDFDNLSDSVFFIAPLFNKEKVNEISLLCKRDSNLINLPGSLREGNYINDYFKTLAITGYDATKTKFIANANRFPYIHISTHGVQFKDQIEAVNLAFSTHDQHDDGWLNFYEILNLNLNAELIVLSACRTGVGDFNNGEGNLNLAWAFHQAGAKASVIGLWDISDYASSQIMPAFYELLKKGYSKPEALRQAKLSYMRNHDEITSAPYYWAAFDFIGDGKSAYVKPDNYLLRNARNIILSAFLVLMVVTIIVLIKKGLLRFT